MYADSKCTCRTTILLIKVAEHSFRYLCFIHLDPLVAKSARETVSGHLKSFVCRRSRCRGRSDLLKLPIKENRGKLTKQTFAFAKNENGCTYLKFVDSNSTKMRISPTELQGRMVIPRRVASSGEECVQLTFLKNLSPADQAKAMKVHGLKIVKT